MAKLKYLIIHCTDTPIGRKVTGMAAVWFNKLDGIMLIPIAAVSIALISFKNESFKKLIFAILKIKNDE